MDVQKKQVMEVNLLTVRLQSYLFHWFKKKIIIFELNLIDYFRGRFLSSSNNTYPVMYRTHCTLYSIRKETSHDKFFNYSHLYCIEYRPTLLCRPVDQPGENNQLAGPVDLYLQYSIDSIFRNLPDTVYSW